MKKYLISLSLVLIAGYGIYFVFNHVTKEKEYYETINFGQFLIEKESDENLVVFVKQDGCYHCENVEPIINEVAKEGKVKVVSIIANREKKAAEFEKEMKIVGTPTIIFMHNGIEKNRIVGEFSKDDLLQKIGEMENEQ